jgi:hypothetical protein
MLKNAVTAAIDTVSLLQLFEGDNILAAKI